jgi:hypothetical protein
MVLGPYDLGCAYPHFNFYMLLFFQITTVVVRLNMENNIPELSLLHLK